MSLQAARRSGQGHARPAVGAENRQRHARAQPAGRAHSADPGHAAQAQGPESRPAHRPSRPPSSRTSAPNPSPPGRQAEAQAGRETQGESRPHPCRRPGRRHARLPRRPSRVKVKPKKAVHKSHVADASTTADSHARPEQAGGRGQKLGDEFNDSGRAEKSQPPASTATVNSATRPATISDFLPVDSRPGDGQMDRPQRRGRNRDRPGRANPCRQGRPPCPRNA